GERPSGNRPGGGGERPGGNFANRPGGRPSQGDLQNFLDIPGGGGRPGGRPAFSGGGGAADEFLHDRPSIQPVRPGGDEMANRPRPGMDRPGFDRPGINLPDQGGERPTRPGQGGGGEQRPGGGDRPFRPGQGGSGEERPFRPG